MLFRSVQLNDNRAVFRSTFSIDDDKAGSTADISGIFGGLGFEKLALLEGTNALVENPTNGSAHRLLASAYANLPRHDIARVSEALTARLLQPISAKPIDSQLSNDKLFVTRDTGPSQAGISEFNSLFSRNQTNIHIDTTAGTRNTFGDQFILSGLSGRVSFALSQFHYETDGFKDNDASNKDIYGLFINTQPVSTATVQLEIKRTQFSKQQTFFAFDPDPDINSPVRIAETSNSSRIGGNYSLGSNATILWTAGYEDRTRTVWDTRFDVLSSVTVARSKIFEVQNIQRFPQGELIVGGRWLLARDYFEQRGDAENGSSNLYIYGTWHPNMSNLILQGGVSADSVTVRNSAFQNQLRRRRASPKVGIIWSPSQQTTLRLGALSSTKSRLVGNQTIEPTQIAGFNQFFTGFDEFYGDIDGTIASRYGVSLERRFSSATYVGGEITRRKLDVYSFRGDRHFDWRESTGKLWIYKISYPHSDESTAKWRLVSSIEYEYEKLERPKDYTGPEGILNVRTHYFPLAIKIFCGSRFTFASSITFVDQSGLFAIDEGLPEFQRNQKQWITDVSLQYLLPKKRGFISLGAKNLFDKEINLFETDPVNPRITGRRLIFIKAKFAL